MLKLFRMEAESQSQVLTTGLLAMERDPAAADQLEACMRAAHSLKGAARIVGLDAGVGVAHAMEDCFVAAQRGDFTLRQRQIDLLLGGVDLLTRIANTPEADVDQWAGEKLADVNVFLATLTTMQESPEGAAPLTDAVHAAPAEQPLAIAVDARESSERVLAGHRRQSQPPARTGGRVAGGIALAQAVRRIAAAAQAPAIRHRQDA